MATQAEKRKQKMEDSKMEQSRIRRKSDLVMSDLGDEVVLLDLEEGHYFGLNDVGSFVWRMLGEGPTVGEVERAIVEEYAVTRERCRQDLRSLLTELSEKGLIDFDSRDDGMPDRPTDSGASRSVGSPSEAF